MTADAAVALLLAALVVGGMVARPIYPKLPTWSLMSLAAFIAVFLGPLTVDDVPRVINVEVVLFLVGMFSIVALAELSGLLDAFAYWFVSLFKSRLSVYTASSLLFGLLSAFAVNDTVALMGPPVAAAIARASGIEYRHMFLLLAFSLTIGSVMTPIGNPQNMLIAVESGIKAPFITFLSRLAIPTLINLIITPVVLFKILGIKNERVSFVALPKELIKNGRDAAVAAVVLIGTVAAMAANDLAALSGHPHIHNIGFIPFVAASLLYFFASSPREVLARVEWGTVIFFLAMFITMEAIWRGGILQPIISAVLPTYTGSAYDILAITAISLFLSQVLSNVPFVSLFSTYLHSLGVTDPKAWLTLAMASTIAGNLTLLGAASNIIILEVLETRFHSTITFAQFIKYGSLITAINTAIYLPFLLI
ncbi:arsenite transport protein, conjectural [Pyrobaculum aerophilum str. IM2]|uniref:Arsenite transport protein, conjectural n=2 Tax=Pyrobaculum aerophilum TaxID=13773 RepID=Q8ZV49_PYRAE|nr:anion transporter [Pyrobaculum aerophilum]AAL64207.1 arsenite transport protein, conjectural [Pyrobaculum aerophilum str. IM2]HII47033.1 anion transporter [Pyrobaculum aerophilum]